MRHLIAAAAVAALVPAVAIAEPVAPADVQYEEGAIAQSLTGVPGDPAGGVKVMTDRGLGNCIACHAVTALQDYPFHGEVGPTLDGAGDRWSEAELRGIVADAKHTFDGTVMPSFYKKTGYIRPGIDFTTKPAKDEDLSTLLTAQQIEDVVAYLVTLKE